MTTTATEQAALLVLRQLVADIEAGVVGVVAQASADGPEGCSLTVRWAAIGQVTETVPSPSPSPSPPADPCRKCGADLRTATEYAFDDGARTCRVCHYETPPLGQLPQG
jgi:ribosomal protein L40E